MKIANSPRISAKQHILPGRCGHRPPTALIKRIFSEFHMSNIQRAQIKRLVPCIVRLGNPIGRPPEGRSLQDAPLVNGTQNQNAFFRRVSAYSRPQRLFFAYFFSDKPEKVCRQRHPAYPNGSTLRLRRIQMCLRRYPAPSRRKKKQEKKYYVVLAGADRAFMLEQLRICFPRSAAAVRTSSPIIKWSSPSAWSWACTRRLRSS